MSELSPRRKPVQLDWDGPLGIVLDAVAECQAQLHDDRSAVLGKIRAELEAPALLKAMFDIGYFPPRTPPDTAP